jgi:hypothetical protein
METPSTGSKSDKLTTAIVSVLLAIIGVAIIALIVSSKANTSSVIGAGGSAFTGSLACALSPVTGGTCGGGSASLTVPTLPTTNPVPNVQSTVTYPTG